MKLHTLLRTIALAATALSVGRSVRPSILHAQKTSEKYTKQVAMVPMRDGIKLNTEIYMPKEGAGPRALVLTRTPYGLGHDDDGFSPAMATQYKELAEDGYIFVFQDIRGRFKSEGQFVMMRNPRDPKDARAIDEGTDTYDTIDWMIKNIPGNNGRVGLLGISYGGWLTVMGILEPHPALKAASPQASPIDMWLGDDFHHNGAFRLAYGFGYAAMMESSKEITPFAYDEYDGYEWFLKVGSLANINPNYLGGKIPTWNDFAGHPNYDKFWQKQSVAGYLNKVTVPTLNVAGWWDQEDFYGPIQIYEALEKHDTRFQNLLVVGPWNHGGWARGDGDQLGKIKFGTAPSRYYREQVQRPFFAHWLKDGPDPKLPEALVYETGANKWAKYDTWPPKNVTTERKIYFQAGGKLSFTPPTDADDNANDAYVSDPAKPVPYRARPIPDTFGPGSTWGAWLVDDQRHAHMRPDVLSWESEPLTDDIVVSGHILANLFLSTSGTDGDWVVKLIDVYPEKDETDRTMGGYQLMVANEVMRARFRNSWEKPEPLVAGQTFPLTVDMRNMNHRFRKGHRIMVQVQSSWFPLIDRNPQTFVPNIFEAKESDFKAATQRVFRSGKFASNVALPVVQGGLTP